MEIPFGESARSDIGIEWELECVDRETGELVPVAPQVLEALSGSEGYPEVTKELLTNTLEIVSGPHDRVRDAVADLETAIDRIRVLTDPMGVDLMCSGTHPFSAYADQEVTPSERYDRLIDRTRWWGRQLMIWGVHMHIGIEDREKIMPILDGMLVYYPHFQALSASSPYWVGDDTGYASNRAMLFQQMPTAGLPPQLGTWANYEQVVDDLVHVGVIDDHSELRWDLRPSPKWGTLEIRFCDGVSNVNEMASLAALAQCLVEHLSEELDAGRPIPTMQPWYVRENKWRAARYGLDAIIIQNAAGDERLVTEDTRDLVSRLEPVADRLGCVEELAGVLDILDSGSSYQRQRAAAEAADGDLRAVVGELVRELREGVRR